MNVVYTQLRGQLKSKLEEIANILLDPTIEFNEPGVLAGISGKALFLFYYSFYTGDSKYADIGEQALEQALDMINKGFVSFNYYSGISGFVWTCEHLAQHGFIELNDSTLLDKFRPYLYSAMEYELLKGNYNFLQGGLGIALYFLMHKNNHTEINKLLECLDQTAEKMPDRCWKWKSVLDPKSQRIGYDISLSLGMSGIVACMSKLYRQNPKLRKSKEILSGAVKYILQQKLLQSQISYFPTYSLDYNDGPNFMQGRLAWCYGDLGISEALLRASKALNDTILQNFAIEVLSFCCTRKDIETSFVNDTALCHGTAGIAHIFQRVYHETENLIFYDAANYWLAKTLEMAKFKDGLAGFKKWSGSARQWINCYSLVEGISGIGLCFITALDSKLLSWDECLLLS